MDERKIAEGVKNLRQHTAEETLQYGEILERDGNKPYAKTIGHILDTEYFYQMKGLSNIHRKNISFEEKGMETAICSGAMNAIDNVKWRIQDFIEKRNRILEKKEGNNDNLEKT